MPDLFCTPWLRFGVRGLAYAVPLAAVAEVTHARRPRLVPFVRLEVGGVVNVRGEPLVAVNGGALLLRAPAQPGRQAFVLESGPARIGVLVDRVAGIERGLGGPARARVEPPPDAATLSCVCWVARAGASVGLLEPDALFARAAALLTGQGLQGGEEPCQDAC